MVRNGFVKAVLVFCSIVLIYKAFCVFGRRISVRTKINSSLSIEFLRTLTIKIYILLFVLTLNKG